MNLIQIITDKFKALFSKNNDLKNLIKEDLKNIIEHKNGNYYFKLKEDFSLEVTTDNENPKLEYPEILYIKWYNLYKIPYIDEIMPGTTVVIVDVLTPGFMDYEIKKLAEKNVFVIMEILDINRLEYFLEFFKFENFIGIVYENLYANDFRYISNTNKNRTIETTKYSHIPTKKYYEHFKHFKTYKNYNILERILVEKEVCNNYKTLKDFYNSIYKIFS